MKLKIKIIYKNNLLMKFNKKLKVKKIQEILIQLLKNDIKIMNHFMKYNKKK